MVSIRLRLVALVAAYAVALQGLLSTFAPVAAAWPGTGLLCAQQVAGEPAPSSGHDENLCAAACVMHGVSAAPPPPDVVVPSFAVKAAAEPLPCSTQFRPLRRGVQTARAPPSV